MQTSARLLINDMIRTINSKPSFNDDFILFFSFNFFFFRFREDDLSELGK